MYILGYNTDEKKACELLEGIVDRFGIERTLDMLSSICFNKAQHVLENWNDLSTSKYWQKVGKKLDHSHAIVTHI